MLTILQEKNKHLAWKRFGDCVEKIYGCVKKKKVDWVGKWVNDSVRKWVGECVWEKVDYCVRSNNLWLIIKRLVIDHEKKYDCAREWVSDWVANNWWLSRK